MACDETISSLLEVPERFGDTFLLLDRHWRFAFLNARASEIAGRPPEALLGRVIWEVYPSLLGTPLEEAYRRAMRERTTVQFEHPGTLSGAWYEVHVYPVRVGIAVHGRDVSDRRRAEVALRESEERFRAQYDNLPVPTYTYRRDGDDFVLVSFNRAADAATGHTVGQLVGRRAGDLYPDEPGIVEALRQCYASRAPVRRDMRYRFRLTGQVRELAVTYAFVPPDLVMIHTEDVTERARAERELREVNETLERRVAERTAELEARTRELQARSEQLARSEQAHRQSEHRYARAAEAGRVGVWEFEVTSGALYLAPDLKRLLGYSDAELPNRLDAWYALVHPDDKQRVIDATADHLDGRTPVYAVEVRRRHRDGGYRWFLAQGRAVRDERGVAVRLVGSDTEITERKQAAERLRESERHHRELAEQNRRLVRELAHRVGNNLASLLALVPMIRNRATDVDSFAAAIEARVRAMAHVHRMLTQSDWRPVGLRTLVATALDAMGYVAPHACREVTDGPDVSVAPRQVLPLTLVLVELYTNSCKYGAHRSPDGRLRVTWELRPARAATAGGNGEGARGGAPAVALRWEERGGPAVVGPIRPSLGTELVHAFVAGELGGRCDLRFPPEGADHVIEFPVDQGTV